MVMISANWAELLTPQLTEAFYVGFTAGGRRVSLIPNIFRVENSQRAFEEHLGIGQFGSAAWNFEDSGRVQYDERNKGYKATFTHVEFAKGFMVQRKLIDDNQTNIAFDSATELGDSAFRKREKSAASVFNRAFLTTADDDNLMVVGPDGVALCGAHPYSPSDSTTQSNAGTAALDKNSIKATRIAMMGFLDDRGDKLDVQPDRILVPPELEDDAIIISRSALDPATNNNAINPQAGRFGIETWHYLTDATNWFMIDSARRARDLIWYERIPVEFDREQDFDTFIAKYRAYMRYSRGWRDYRWVYGQNVAG